MQKPHSAVKEVIDLCCMYHGFILEGCPRVEFVIVSPLIKNHNEDQNLENVSNVDFVCTRSDSSFENEPENQVITFLIISDATFFSSNY